MAKTINYRHMVSLKTTVSITLSILYILERVTLKECIYAWIIYALIYGTLEYILKLLKAKTKKLEVKIEKAETETKE